MWARHLSRDALMTLVEHGGTHHDRRHIEQCERCRFEVETLRATLASVRGVEVPEPSPLFWTHFSDRVSRAVGQESSRGVRSSDRAATPWRSTAWLAATALVVIVAVTATWRRGDESTAVADQGASAPAASAADADWEFLLDLADVADDQAVGEGMEAVQPGTADRLLVALSDTERTALVELLERAMRQPSS